MRIKRILMVGLVAGSIGAAAILYSVGSLLVTPKPASVGRPPIDLPYERVLIPRNDGASTHGWFLAGAKDIGGILLLHGVRSDRREMLERSRFLSKAGYAVLLIDMQAHGETPGEYITFGYLESFDVQAALAFLRTRVTGRPVGVIGASMGGAAAILGREPINADALVLEGVFSNLEKAIENRISLRFGRKVGKALTPLLSMQFEPRLGIPLRLVAPSEAIANVGVPLMIVSGSLDMHALPSEAKTLYDRANKPKSLWLVDGAIHQNLHQFAKIEYEERILEFFGRYLK